LDEREHRQTVAAVTVILGHTARAIDEMTPGACLAIVAIVAMPDSAPGIVGVQLEATVAPAEVASTLTDVAEMILDGKIPPAAPRVHTES